MKLKSEFPQRLPAHQILVQIRINMSKCRWKFGGVGFACALNISLSKGGTNSSHMHKLAISKLPRAIVATDDINFMKTINSMLIYYRFQKNECMLVISACHTLVSNRCQVPEMNNVS